MGDQLDKMDTTIRTTETEDWRHLPLQEMEARCARFEKAVWDAQLAAPPTRDLLKSAVTRTGASRCPVWLRRVTPDLIIRYGQELIDLFTEFPDDLGRVAPYDLMVGYNTPSKVTPVEALMMNAEWVSEWGVTWKHIIGGVGATEVDSPLKDWAKLDEYIATLPDADEPGRLDAAAPPCKKLHGAGKYVFGLFGSAYFQPFEIRGFENALVDLHLEPDNMHKLIEAIHSYNMKLVKHWAKVGVDSLLFLDDWGTQHGPLVSPTTWREFFKPRYKELFAETHRLGMDCFLHSCGNIVEIIGDLIEIGLDVLDPIQTSAMDINELAAKFGGQITFQGTLDVQKLLPYGKPQEIKDTIRRTIDTLAKPFGNALTLAPTNTITPDVPIENLRAMFEACHLGQ
jgi:uroporphyrinogen decarboxylase